MQNTEMIVIGVGAIVALFALVGVALWGSGQAERAKSWPTTDATIQSVQSDFVAVGGPSKTELPVYTFSYVVNGEYYAGRFCLEGALKWELADTKFSVRYDPNRPSIYRLPDYIAGCFVWDEG